MYLSSYYIVRPHTDTAALPLVFPLSLLFFRLWVRSVFKNQTAAWGKVIVLSPGSGLGLAQDPCALLLPLCHRARLRPSFREQLLLFFGIS